MCPGAGGPSCLPTSVHFAQISTRVRWVSCIPSQQLGLKGRSQKPCGPRAREAPVGGLMVLHPWASGWPEQARAAFLRAMCPSLLPGVLGAVRGSSIVWGPWHRGCALCQCGGVFLLCRRFLGRLKASGHWGCFLDVHFGSPAPWTGSVRLAWAGVQPGLPRRTVHSRRPRLVCPPPVHGVLDVPSLVVAGAPLRRPL